MATITVAHLAGERFAIETRGHRVDVDQPSREGKEAGPTPTELFVGGLAACAAHYAAGFLRRSDLPFHGVRVECQWRMKAGPPRVGAVELRVVTPEPVTGEQRERLRDAIAQCVVHNSLRQPPAVTVELAQAAEYVADRAAAKV